MVFFDTLGPLLLIAYIKGRGLHKKTWGGWSWESLRGWSQFLKLGVAGYLMIAFEWWAFEITTLVTGSISQEQLAANTALFQFANLAYMVSLPPPPPPPPNPPSFIIKGPLNLLTHHNIDLCPFSSFPLAMVQPLLFVLVMSWVLVIPWLPRELHSLVSSLSWSLL